MRFTLPATPDDADAMAREFAVIATATNWARGALVYARVVVRDSPGRVWSSESTALIAKSGNYQNDWEARLTPQSYADLGIVGLRSRTSVMQYWRCWHLAVADGIAVPVRLGDQVDLPDVDFQRYYRAANLIFGDEPTWEEPPPRREPAEVPTEDQPGKGSDAYDPPETQTAPELPGKTIASLLRAHAKGLRAIARDLADEAYSIDNRHDWASAHGAAVWAIGALNDITDLLAGKEPEIP